MIVAMSFSGANFDIASGIGACLLAPLIALGRAPRWLVLAWNVLGTTLLAIGVAIAIAATPMFRAFGDGELNTWVAHFPFVYLPSVMVAFALVGHLLVFRRLAGGEALRSRPPARAVETGS